MSGHPSLPPLAEAFKSFITLYCASLDFANRNFWVWLDSISMRLNNDREQGYGIFSTKARVLRHNKDAVFRYSFVRNFL